MNKNIRRSIENLTGTVGGTAGPLAGNAVTGVEGVADSVSPGYVPRGPLTP